MSWGQEHSWGLHLCRGPGYITCREFPSKHNDANSVCASRFYSHRTANTCATHVQSAYWNDRINGKGKWYWNDRRSRRVFLCFYSAIFQLTSAKFHTFAYNSRTVWSSFMKFWQQFEINELYVCTKFRGNRSRDFGFRTRKPPRKFGVKSGLSQKRLSTAKNISYGCMS